MASVDDVQALPLVTNKRWLTWFCVCPLEDSAGVIKKIMCIIFSSIVFAFNVLALIASVAFFLQYVSSNLEKSLYALFQIGSFTCMSYLICIAILLRHKITDLFNSLTKIYELCKKCYSNFYSLFNLWISILMKTHFISDYPDKPLFHFLNEANKGAEKSWALYIQHVLIGYVLTNAIVSLCSILTCMIVHGRFITTSLYEPYKTR